MKRNFRALITDMDGVVLNTEAIYLDADRYGVETMLSCVHDPKIYPDTLMGQTTEFYFKGLRDIFREAVFPPDLEMRMWQYSEKLMERDLRLIEGAVEFFQALTVPFAIASNGTMQCIEQRLQRTKAYEIFAPRIYSGHAVPRKKPFPDLFLHAAKEMDVSPEDCIVIEDSVPGVIAGVAAGMSVIGFCGGGHCYDGYEARLTEAGAIATVRSYPELANALAA